jgi:hypothetical protein
MPEITEYDNFIHQYVKRFQNITFLDPSITMEDLQGEAYMIYAKLLNTPLSCKLITALGNQLQQRFTDMYRVASRLNAHLDREQVIQNFAAREVKISKIQFEELPSHLKQLLKRIYDSPEEIAEVFPKNYVGKTVLIEYLTEKLQWQKSKACRFAAMATQSRRRPCLERSTPA